MWKRRGTNVWRSGEGPAGMALYQEGCLLPLTNLGIPSIFPRISENLSVMLFLGPNLGLN